MNKGIPFPISSCTTHKWPWKSLKAVSHTDQVNSNSMGTKLAGLAYPEQRAPWPGGGHWEALTHSIQCRITWFLKGNVKSKRLTNRKKKKKITSGLAYYFSDHRADFCYSNLRCSTQ